MITFPEVEIVASHNARHVVWPGPLSSLSFIQIQGSELTLRGRLG